MVDSLWYRASLYLITGLTVAVWLAMLAITMPHLEALTGGLKVFDMRPLGYTFDEAKAILAGLGEAGRQYYRDTRGYCYYVDQYGQPHYSYDVRC